MLPVHDIDDVQNNQNRQDPPLTTTPLTPGALNYVPANPEVVPTIANEIAPETEVVNEKTPNKETVKIPKPQYLEEQQNAPLYNTPATKPEKSTPKVVDDTKETTKFHHLNTSKDPLTLLADKEEEEFISDVEAAHGHH